KAHQRGATFLDEGGENGQPRTNDEQCDDYRADRGGPGCAIACRQSFMRWVHEDREHCGPCERGEERRKDPYDEVTEHEDGRIRQDRRDALALSDQRTSQWPSPRIFDDLQMVRALTVP